MTEETNTGAAAATEAQAAAQQFALQRVYLKDLSFESPMGVKAFMKEWKPAVNQELNTKAAKIDAENYEVVLTLTITVKIGEETAFLVEVQQAGFDFVEKKAVAMDDQYVIVFTKRPDEESKPEE